MEPGLIISDKEIESHENENQLQWEIKERLKKI